MNAIKVIKSLALALITISCQQHKAKTCRLNDVVEFKFSERNLFYANACNNFGTVRDWSTYGGTKYLVRVQCGKDDSFGQFIWVDAEDIIDVLRLGKYGSQQ